MVKALQFKLASMYCLLVHLACSAWSLCFIACKTTTVKCQMWFVKYFNDAFVNTNNCSLKLNQVCSFIWIISGEIRAA